MHRSKIYVTISAGGALIKTQNRNTDVCYFHAKPLTLQKNGFPTRRVFPANSELCTNVTVLWGNLRALLS